MDREILVQALEIQSGNIQLAVQIGYHQQPVHHIQILRGIPQKNKQIPFSGNGIRKIQKPQIGDPVLIKHRCQAGAVRGTVPLALVKKTHNIFRQRVFLFHVRHEGKLHLNGSAGIIVVQLIQRHFILRAKRDTEKFNKG